MNEVVKPNESAARRLRRRLIVLLTLEAVAISLLAVWLASRLLARV